MSAVAIMPFLVETSVGQIYPARQGGNVRLRRSGSWSWSAHRSMRGDATNDRGGRSAMTIRVRKLIGTLGILAFVIVYALVAMGLAQGRITEAPGWLQAILYAALGLAWIFPAMLVIRWMETGRIRR